MNGVCPICGCRTNLTKHHILKRVVFPELKNKRSNTIAICRHCHDALEIVITEKENAILRKYKEEIYVNTLKDFIEGRIDPDRVIKRKRRKSSFTHL